MYSTYLEYDLEGPWFEVRLHVFFSVLFRLFM